MDIKNEIEKLAERYFNKEVKSIPEKIRKHSSRMKSWRKTSSQLLHLFSSYFKCKQQNSC